MKDTTRDLLRKRSSSSKRHSKKNNNNNNSSSNNNNNSNGKDPMERCPSFSLTNDNEIQALRCEVPRAHVESFNFFLSKYGMANAVSDIPPHFIDLQNYSKDTEDNTTTKTITNPDGTTTTTVVEQVDTIKLWYENICIHKPSLNGDTRKQRPKKLYPRDCRELGIMYSGRMTGDFCYQFIHRTITYTTNSAKSTKTIVKDVAQGNPVKLFKHFGDMPIMIMSKACHLYGKQSEELMRCKEEQNEFGGYFIVSGIERCIRLLQIPRRNHPTAIQRSSYKKRGTSYTDLGVSIRCSRYNHDQSSVTNTLHYLSTGGASLRFTIRKQEFLIPVILILRALSVDRFVVSSSSGTSNRTNEVVIENGLSGGGCGITDEELYHRLIEADPTNTNTCARAELLLQDARQYKDLQTPIQCLAYIGSRFRALKSSMAISDSTPNIIVGRYILDRFILIHLQSYNDKLECLLFTLRKLYTLVSGECLVDNADSLQNQELLLPGHLITTFVKEKFEEIILAVRMGLQKEMRLDYTKLVSKLPDIKFWNRLVDRYGGLSGKNGGIGKKVQHFLSTGNIISSTGLDLLQISGFTIVAERLNFLRFCGHFRSVHRGQFFMEMKTTSVRKLLPDQWGFLCPVHTPDGGPCGLLSHLALKCTIVSSPNQHAHELRQRYSKKRNSRVLGKGSSTSTASLEEFLITLGVAPVGAGGPAGQGRNHSIKGYLTVCLDGRVIGGASVRMCKSIVIRLRAEKVKWSDNNDDDEKEEEKRFIGAVPSTLEVAFIPPGTNSGPFPGLFLFTGAARLIRPVLHRASGKTEYIGPMEQPFLDIACLSSDIREGVTTHQELDPNNILSLIASLTPFSDYNQSPRNMYQCQMAKQTMGTPCHSFPHRTDNKLYRLQNPQAPIAQTARHGQYKMDEYPNGTNAVVAVLSYTGFDMEDAMILNKSSYERGFGHASVYKTIKVDLKNEIERAGLKSDSDKARMRFANKKLRKGQSFSDKASTGIGSNDEVLYPSLGMDGLPEVGSWVKDGDPLYCVVDEVTGRDKAAKHRDKESACIQSVRVLGQTTAISSATAQDQKVSITLRIQRNPVIGDKFSSRHGQKGVLSILWPNVDMPFSESGISPDIIINPHAFPSRMTIGMLIESMAGKSGALHGMYQDATPFSFHESGDQIAVDYFGEQLQAAGYSYYGSEPLYSGVSGCIMHADLYIGIVYYQRLRHMVSDKYQVRATGKVNTLTRQPVKGRKKGGGIRLGEMERDSLLSHGTAFLLHDRLFNCSDKHVAYACRRCGDLLSPATERSSVLSAGQSFSDSAAGKVRLRVFCRNPKCRDVSTAGEDGDDDMVEPIAIPYVFRYLANELAAMNIKMTLDIK